ncbi:hypothetical protein THRCLA_22245 [Thraustotheca clavata]|uniref:Uncharacterized protein n=1 Tax=Thraustotheca clavata TaxID=74557 RepID=A0A1V9Z8P9_9STRA|nr:hypothetical protein THRCLA_22245 [Thraustotheca clavata]
MHAILDEEYEKVESTFVKYGLIEYTETYRKSSIEDEPEHNRLALTFAYADVIPLPFDLLRKYLGFCKREQSIKRHHGNNKLVYVFAQ